MLIVLHTAKQTKNPEDQQRYANTHKLYREYFRRIKGYKLIETAEADPFHALKLRQPSLYRGNHNGQLGNSLQQDPKQRPNGRI
jgi:hypothetical protein